MRIYACINQGNRSGDFGGGEGSMRKKARVVMERIGID